VYKFHLLFSGNNVTIFTNKFNFKVLRKD